MDTNKLRKIIDTAPHTGSCSSTSCSNKVFRGYFGPNDYVFPEFPVFKFDAEKCDCWKKQALETLGN